MVIFHKISLSKTCSHTISLVLFDLLPDYSSGTKNGKVVVKKPLKSGKIPFRTRAKFQKALRNLNPEKLKPKEISIKKHRKKNNDIRCKINTLYSTKSSDLINHFS